VLNELSDEEYQKIYGSDFEEDGEAESDAEDAEAAEESSEAAEAGSEAAGTEG